MGGYLTIDPAVEKWVLMRESTTEHFRWNARNIRCAAILGLVVPGVLLYAAVKADRSLDWRGKGPTRKAVPVPAKEAA